MEAASKISTRMNRKVVLRQRPQGTPLDTDFEIVDEHVAPLTHGEVLVQVDVLSIDAFIRTVLDEGGYHSTTGIGHPVTALGVGQVLESNAEGLVAGDWVFGPLGAQMFATLPGGAVRKLDTTSVSPTAYLGALGLTTGMTAYFGIFEVGAVKPGETVVVSGAAGAVGSIAGQLARLAGAGRVIGIAGGPDKVSFLVDELGFDAAIDYKHENVEARLRELAPEGVNVFYDNVGGDILDAVLMNIVEGSRVVICGAISQYQHMDDVRGPRNYLKLAERHARMEGFAVTHFHAQFPRAEQALGEWLNRGELVMREHYEHGVENFPATLRILLNGGHQGKLLLRVYPTDAAVSDINPDQPAIKPQSNP
jgi:NADPH-dependent curcumin reductase